MYIVALFALLILSWAAYDVWADDTSINESLRWPEPVPDPWYQGWVGQDLYNPSDLVASGRVNAWVDGMITYRIITSNPFCTAAHVDSMDGVSRLTLLRSKISYQGEIVSGIPLLIQVPESLANSTIQALLERPLIRSVQLISPSALPPHINHNAMQPDREWMPYCNPSLSGGVQKYVYEYLIYQDHLKNAILDANLAQDFIASFRKALHNYEPPHNSSPGMLYGARIITNNLTSTEAYLMDNGGKIHSSGPREFPDGRVLPGYFMYADVPYPILLPLTELDDVETIEPMYETLLLSHGFGSTHTEGLDEHEHAEQWHDQGHDGTGIRVGVIDVGFLGIQDAINAGELPSSLISNCIGTYQNLSLCDEEDIHGTQVAEIVMDMAPGAELFIGMPNGTYRTYAITEWMVNQSVDVIVRSATFPVFEGPGDGTYYVEQGELAAIDLAVSNNITWVNAAGNYNEESWYTDNPILYTNLFGNNYVSFGNALDVRYNDVELIAGHSYRFVLRWDGVWYNNNDRPVDLNLHLYESGWFGIPSHVESSADRQPIMHNPRPIETFSFTPTSTGTYRLEIESADGVAPNWVQLFSYSADLQYTTGHVNVNGQNYHSLANAAESNSNGMLAVGAVEENRFAQGAAGYSSRGPTIDGRIKPDIMGLTHVTTYAGQNIPFTGTSAATPHVAGLAALYLDRNTTSIQPHQVVTYLIDNAVQYRTDLGDANNVTGHGFAALPRIVTNTSTGGIHAPELVPLPNTVRIIHQGRDASYGFIVEDLDEYDTLQFTAVSSDPDILIVNPGQQPIMMDNVGGIWNIGGVTLQPRSAGDVTLTLDITDGKHKLVISEDFTVSSNHHPEFNDLHPQYVVGHDSHITQLHAEDVDGDTLAYEGHLPGGTNMVAVDIDDNNMIISPIYETLSLSYMIEFQPILAVVKDGNGGEDYALAITCMTEFNKEPTAISIQDQTMEGTQTLNIPISASDSDGDRMAFTTPYTGNREVAAASMGSNAPYYTILSHIGVGEMATPPRPENITIQNDTVLLTFSSKDLHGNTLHYTLNDTNIVPSIPTSITLASDNRYCAGRSSTSSSLSDVMNLSGFSEGRTAITLSVLDPWGGRAVQNITVTVLPALPPVISVISDQTIYTNSSITITINVTDSSPTMYKAASDNIDVVKVQPTAFTDMHTGEVSLISISEGNATVTITVSDGNLESTQTFVATVVGAPPTLTLYGPMDMKIPYNSTYVEPGYAATDYTGMNITDNVIVTGTIDTTAFGTYTLTYTVADSKNSTTTQARAVTVVDAKPILTLVNPRMTLSQGATYVEPGYTAIDDVDGDISDQVETHDIDTSILGTHAIFYYVTDSGGNTATAVRVVYVVPDILQPVITLYGSHNMIIPFNSTYIEPGYTATDDTDGNLTSNVIVSGTVDTDTPGTYTISYTVSDSAGNMATQTRVITIEDTKRPVLTLVNPRMTISQGSTYVEPGYTAIDNADGDITDLVETFDIDTSILGTHALFYFVTDSSGNTAMAVRVVYVVPDTIPPVITLHGSHTMTIPINSTYVELGYTATDDVDGDITNNVTVTGSINIALAGTYTLYYDITDSSGNTAVQQIRTITVTLDQ